MHVIAAKAVCFGEALQPEFARYAGQVVTNAQASGGKSCPRPACGWCRRHRQSPDAGGFDAAGHHRTAGGAGFGESVHIVVNKNAIPYDQLPPRTCLRPAARHAGHHQPGPGRGGHAAVAPELIVRALGSIGDDGALSAIGEEVQHT